MSLTAEIGVLDKSQNTSHREDTEERLKEQSKALFTVLKVIFSIIQWKNPVSST